MWRTSIRIGRLGGQIYGITEHHKSEYNNPPHLLDPLHYVLFVHGKYIDIRGVWAAENLLQDWTDEQVELSTVNSRFWYSLDPVFDIPDLEDVEGLDDVVSKIVSLL